MKMNYSKEFEVIKKRVTRSVSPRERGSLVIFKSPLKFSMKLQLSSKRKGPPKSVVVRLRREEDYKR